MIFDYFTNPEIWQDGMIKQGTSVNVFFLPCFIVWFLLTSFLVRCSNLGVQWSVIVTSNPISIAFIFMVIATPSITFSVIVFMLIMGWIFNMMKPKQ